MKKNIFKTLFVLALFFMFTPIVKAAGLNVYASKTTAYVGNSIIVTVKTDNLAGKFSVNSSNTSVLSGGGRQDWIEGTITYTFTAKSLGTSTVTVTPVDVADFNGNVFTSSKSVTIKVVEPRKLSTNNYLSKLSIDDATLSPEFNKNTTEYQVELKAGTTEININASKEDSNSKITGADKVSVSEGLNDLEVVVTAENGSTRTYKIKANVKELDPIKVKVNKKELTVIRKKDQLVKPDGYEDTTIKLGEDEVPALYNSKTKLTLLGLKDNKDNINLYIYNEKDKSYKIYNEIKSSITVLILDMDKSLMPNNYKKYTEDINGIKTDVYKLNSSSKFMIIYGMNTKTLKKGLYSYNSKDNTIQVYNQDETKILNNKLNNMFYICIGLIVFSLILIISLIVVSKNKTKDIKPQEIKENKKKKKKLKEIFEDDE